MKTKRDPKRYKIIMDKTLERVMLGYKPEFGNREDMVVARKLGKLRGLLITVDNEVLRGLKKGEAGATPPGKVREILSLEKGLIADITRRNLDF